MAARLFQSLVLQMQHATDSIVGIIDQRGVVIACTEFSCIGEIRGDVVDKLLYSSDVVCINQHTYKLIGDNNSQFEYAVFVKGDDDQIKTLCRIISVSINNVKVIYDERHDKATFVKNIILNNILPGDIYIKSRELHFDNEVCRIVYLVHQIGKPNVSTIDVVNSMFSDKNHDFVIHLSESDIAVVKEIRNGTESKEIVRIAKTIEEKLDSDLLVKAIIGVGSICGQLKDIARSFKEAQVAIEVGGVFDTEKSVISFENLGVGRLIYQLPTTLCEMFLNEVFKHGSIETLDAEILFTIQRFFENNLNVSETSRKLFVHRNTLVYRLEKIKKITGLDLREFDHAIVFKVALMVRKYLASREEGKV